MCCSQHFTTCLLSLRNILFFDWRHTYVVLLIYMLNWNSLVHASPPGAISKLSFWKTEQLPHMHIPIDFINENTIFLQIRVIVTLQSVFLFLQIISEAWIKFLIFTAHSSCHWHYQRCETSMLDLKNAFVICFLFLFFDDFISFGEFYVCMSFGVWVENPYI